MKKKNDFLKNKLDVVFKEKNELSISFKKTKKDFKKYKLVCKGKSPNIAFNKNEFLDIQKRIDVLDTTLKKCAIDMNKFASMFSKGKTQRKHTSHASNTHHTHQHKHAFMYGKVYTCAHCGRKGHLAKFCYAKLNMQNKNVWVRESINPIGPKKI